MKTKSPVLRLIRDDDRYKRLKESFNTLPMFQMPLDDLHKRVETMHKTRPIRNLNPDSPKFADALLRASVDDQATRSNVAGIMLDCTKGISTLTAALDAFRDYVLVRYSDELRTVRTKEERVQLIRTACAPFVRYVNRMQTLKDCCEVLIKDIDQGAWTLKLNVNILELHKHREHII